MARVVALLPLFVSFGLYLVLAGSLSRNELITGAVAAGSISRLVAVSKLRPAQRMHLPAPPLRAMV